MLTNRHLTLPADAMDQTILILLAVLGSHPCNSMFPCHVQGFLPELDRWNREKEKKKKGGRERRGGWILVWAFPRGVECDRKKRFLLPGDPRNELSASENPLERPRSTPRSPQLFLGARVSYMIPCDSKGYVQCTRQQTKADLHYQKISCDRNPINAVRFGLRSEAAIVSCRGCDRMRKKKKPLGPNASSVKSSNTASGLQLKRRSLCAGMSRGCRN